MFLKLPNFHTYENGNNYNGSYNGMRFAIVINKNEDTKDAANRRLKEEMGIYSNLREIFSFIYYVKFDNNLIEHEFDHVFFGIYNGSIKFKGEDITNLTTAERVQLGIGVSFQSPPSIRGVSVRDLLKIESHQEINEPLNARMLELAQKLKFNDEFLDRDVNFGFSGGEVKRSEILQLLAQMPDFTMFDEPDSGVDIENVELIAGEIGTLLDKDIKHDSRKRSGLLITHLGYILNFVSADKAHVLMDGKIACSGNPAEIIEDIRKEGFNGCVECAQCIK